MSNTRSSLGESAVFLACNESHFADGRPSWNYLTDEDHFSTYSVNTDGDFRLSNAASYASSAGSNSALRSGREPDHVARNDRVYEYQNHTGQHNDKTVVQEEPRPRMNFLFSSNKEKDRTKNKPESPPIDHTDKMKTKLLSMWNNVKHGWTVKTKTNFSKESAICLLGVLYDQRIDPLTRDDPDSELERNFRAFRYDFHTRIWMTYRREFPTLAGSTLTTDCGWGCMLRSGQMMLAEGLVQHFLTRDWRWIENQSPPSEEVVHRKIIRWFGDNPKESSPFSLHKLVAIGESSGKRAGDWYGPASVAHILKQAIEMGAEKDDMLDELRIYVAHDCTVYKGDVRKLCKHVDPTTGGEKWRAVIIFIPVRLGGEGFNAVYTHCIQSLLSHRNTLGIIGGRPRHSLYFVGWQENQLIHLDPHYCQEMVNVEDDDFSVASFHCPSPRKMPFTRMDPSCSIGFYCRTEQDFEKVVNLSEEIVLGQSQDGGARYPIFVATEGTRDDNQSIPLSSSSQNSHHHHRLYPALMMPEEDDEILSPLSDDDAMWRENAYATSTKKPSPPPQQPQPQQLMSTSLSSYFRPGRRRRMNSENDSVEEFVVL